MRKDISNAWKTYDDKYLSYVTYRFDRDEALIDKLMEIQEETGHILSSDDLMIIDDYGGEYDECVRVRFQVPATEDQIREVDARIERYEEVGRQARLKLYETLKKEFEPNAE